MSPTIHLAAKNIKYHVLTLEQYHNVWNVMAQMKPKKRLIPQLVISLMMHDVTGIQNNKSLRMLFSQSIWHATSGILG